MTRLLSVLRHSLEVVRSSYSAPDAEGADYGHGTRSTAVVASYRGLIQPRSARERASVSGEGAVLGSFRGYLEPAAIGNVGPDDVIRKAAVAPGASLAGDYRILSVANAAGWDHHLELDLERVDP